MNSLVTALHSKPITRRRIRQAVGYVIKPLFYLVFAFALAAFSGLLLYRFQPTAAFGREIWILSYIGALKMAGRAPDCDWKTVWLTPNQITRMLHIRSSLESQITLVNTDVTSGLHQYHTPQGTFWIPQSGEQYDGRGLLAYLLTDHLHTRTLFSKHHVQTGDIVIDCGAHVGVFTAIALQAGAAMVIAIEPDPVNRECLRRNLAKEISAGRVKLVPQAVWSSNTTLTLVRASTNSGRHSVAGSAVDSTASVSVDTTTLDQIVSSLDLPRVNFIKLDIEGAEREAIRGGFNVIQRFRPTLMLDSYHLPDDIPAFSKLIASADTSYLSHASYCQALPERRAVPHVTFWRPAN